MPCNSEHMNPTTYEREISRVACLLDEIKHGKLADPAYWSGYHPRVYTKVTRSMGDKMVKSLCEALQGVDVSKYSLEMQMWWREHQAADKIRVQKEIDKAASEEKKAAALAKLTAYERKLLGLE